MKKVGVVGWGALSRETAVKEEQENKCGENEEEVKTYTGLRS